MNDLKLYIKFINKMYDLSNAIHAYESIPREYGTKMKLYMKEVHTLAIIFENPGIALSDIAELENKTKSCISQRINRLKSKGLVRKERNPEDYKKANLFLTEEGRIIAEYHANLDKRNYSAVLLRLSKWTNSDFERFIELLCIIEEAVVSDS